MNWPGRSRIINARRLAVVGCLWLDNMHAHKGRGGSAINGSDFTARRCHIDVDTINNPKEC